MKNASLFAFHITYSFPIYPISLSHWYTTYHAHPLLSALFCSIWCSGVRFIIFLSTILTSRLLLPVPPPIHYLVTNPSLIASALQDPNLPSLGCSSDGWLNSGGSSCAICSKQVLFLFFFFAQKQRVKFFLRTSENTTLALEEWKIFKKTASFIYHDFRTSYLKGAGLLRNLASFTFLQSKMTGYNYSLPLITFICQLLLPFTM